MHVFKTVKGVTKTDILCAVLEHNVHVAFYGKSIQLDEGVKITKQKNA